MSPIQPDHHPLQVIGLGVGDLRPPPEAEGVLAQADLLVGGRRQLAAFADHPAEKLVIAGPLEPLFGRLAEARGLGRRPVVLADGDPLFFGVGERLAAFFGPDSLIFWPSLSSVQLAAARLGLPWREAAFVSLHGRSDAAPLWAALMERQRVFAFTDARNDPAALARLLLGRGLDARLVVLEDLGSARERIRRLTLAEAAEVRAGPLNLLLIEQAAPPSPQVLGRPDDWYVRERGLVTKWPVRAAALAALALAPGQTVWDVGAGCGSVAVEAAGLVCRLGGGGRVFALERDEPRTDLIRENVRRAGAWGVTVVPGRAPEALAGLPDPDRVFVGGGLGDALEAVCGRLKPGGRVVVSAVLLGTLGRALDAFTGLGWAPRVAQIQAALSAELAGDRRLAAGNPVFLVIADKPV